MEGSSVIKPELVIKYKFPQRTFTHDERDVAQYALGVGACATNALDDQELKYVYHEDGQKFIKVLPAFAAIYPGLDTREISGSSFDPHRLLHAQHFTEIYRPLSTSGCIRNRTSGVGLHDKGYLALSCMGFALLVLQSELLLDVHAEEIKTWSKAYQVDSFTMCTLGKH